MPCKDKIFLIVKPTKGQNMLKLCSINVCIFIHIVKEYILYLLNIQCDQLKKKCKCIQI